MAEHTETRPASAGAEEREEGEIADDRDGSAAAGRGAGAVSAHPLENAWTFWFDNPQGKSRQVAWGSTIHPIHTFSTVEDFWGYCLPPPSNPPLSYQIPSDWIVSLRMWWSLG
jgi:translation initiation factor 4E